MSITTNKLKAKTYVKLCEKKAHEHNNQNIPIYTNRQNINRDNYYLHLQKSLLFRRVHWSLRRPTANTSACFIEESQNIREIIFIFRNARRDPATVNLCDLVLRHFLMYWRPLDDFVNLTVVVLLYVSCVPLITLLTFLVSFKNLVLAATFNRWIFQNVLYRVLQYL